MAERFGVQVTLVQRADDLWVLKAVGVDRNGNVVRDSAVLHEPSVSVERAVEIADAIDPEVGRFVRQRLADHAHEREQFLASRHEEMERTASAHREEIARVAARTTVARGWADRFPPPPDHIPF